MRVQKGNQGQIWGGGGGGGGGGGRGGRTPPLSEFETLVMGLFVSVHAPLQSPTPRSVFTRVIYLFKVTVIIPVSLSSIKGD